MAGDECVAADAAEAAIAGTSGYIGEEGAMQAVIQVATAAHVRDVWFDGNEEIVEIGATCPNDDCRFPIVTSFTRPRITTKVQRCRRCGESMTVIRPAFGFERGDEPGRAD
jgi:hypothetical protein